MSYFLIKGGHFNVASYGSKDREWKVVVLDWGTVVNFMDIFLLSTLYIFNKNTQVSANIVFVSLFKLQFYTYFYPVFYLIGFIRMSLSHDPETWRPRTSSNFYCGMSS